MDTEYTKGFRAGLAWEQERIIKLLESKIIISNVLSPDKLPEWDYTLNLTLQHTIQLIKGETNE
jgi:hypothetical protein